MVKKILLLLLIASIHSEKTPLKVTQIDDYKEHKISNQNNSLVCVELNKDLKKDQKFYIVVFTKQKGETIDKDIHYNITETSCKNDTFDIDLTNLKKEFEKTDNNPDEGDDKEGFSYLYILEKKEDNQKYAFILIKGYSGTEFYVGYSPIDLTKILVIILSVVGVIIVAIVVTIIVCCCCCCKKRQQIQGQFQSSYVAEPIMPQENIIQ